MTEGVRALPNCEGPPPHEAFVETPDDFLDAGAYNHEELRLNCFIH
jgi:hypothetical protein